MARAATNISASFARHRTDSNPAREQTRHIVRPDIADNSGSLMWNATPEQLRQMALEARQQAAQSDRPSEERRVDLYLAWNYERLARLKEEFSFGDVG
jgi:hypothetical protein